MVLSQSAAIAAGLAIDKGVTVQEVEYSQLRERLEANKQSARRAAPPNPRKRRSS